ncbi:MAG TPA: hypothetical protein VEN30_05870 [Paraburkholderia sp.]|nr:hypothetical protein [Paraburkholderia sp.]
MTVEAQAQLPQYPVLTFAIRHRASLPLVVAVLALAVGIWADLRLHASDFIMIGVLAAVILYVVTKGVLELLELVVELLVPR